MTQMMTCVFMYTVLNQISDIECPCWTINGANDYLSYICLSFLMMFIARLHALFCSTHVLLHTLLCIGMVSFVIFLLSVFRELGDHAFWYIAFHVGCYNYAMNIVPFLLFGIVVVVGSRINQSRFTTDGLCYRQLINWLHESNNINTQNDMIIRLIAINLCIDCHDNVLKECFYNIDMATIQSIISSKEKIKMKFCDLLDTFGSIDTNSCGSNYNRHYARDVSLTNYFISRSNSLAFHLLHHQFLFMQG